VDPGFDPEHHKKVMYKYTWIYYQVHGYIINAYIITDDYMIHIQGMSEDDEDMMQGDIN
jgi:hypothetical protein